MKLQFKQLLTAHNQTKTENEGYAPGVTVFMTDEGADLTVRTPGGGMSKARLDPIDENFLVYGGVVEMPSTSKLVPVILTTVEEPGAPATLEAPDLSKVWTVELQEKGQYFAHWTPWPKKAAAVKDLAAMRAALKAKAKAKAKS